jgi:hypothetical protein
MDRGGLHLKRPIWTETEAPVVFTARSVGSLEGPVGAPRERRF